MRHLIGPTLKRQDVAITQEELNAKLGQEKNRPSKKNLVSQTEQCEETFYWRDLGPDHYPVIDLCYN